MKLFLHTLAITALSLYCVQTVSAAKQPVRASKTNAFDAREVTVRIFGKDKNKPLSKSTFKNDTSGLLTGKLFFDFTKGHIHSRGFDNANTIRATYGESEAEFTLEVLPGEAPKGSEIKIVGNTIEIDTSKVKDTISAQKASIVEAKIQVPAKTGAWYLVSGKKDLNQVIAQAQGKSEIVLDKIEGFENGSNKHIKIYKNKPTAMYASKGTTEAGVITQLSLKDVKNAGSTPLVLIDKSGKAKIINEFLIGLEKEEIVVQPESEQDKQFMSYATQGLPYHVALKALLLSKDDDDYVQRRNSLLQPIRGSELQAIDDAKVKELMDKTISSYLGQTPYVSAKLSFNWDKSRKVVLLEKQYKKIHHSLTGVHPSFWQAENNESIAGNLFMAMWKLLD